MEFPQAYYTGLTQLDAGEYFACHETLEEIWRAEPGPIREVYQGVLQIAVGCHHLVSRSNWVGAVNKLDAGARRLERSPFAADDSALRDLIRQADRLRDHLVDLGRERLDSFDRGLLPRSLPGQGRAARQRAQRSRTASAQTGDSQRNDRNPERTPVHDRASQRPPRGLSR